MSYRKILSFVLALSLSLSWTIAMAEEPIKIGGIGVLTGPAAMYGLSVQKGIDLYVDQINQKGGINGRKVEVIWMDSQGDPTVGIQAYNKLVDNDGVIAIFGPVLTSVTKAVAEYAADIGIPMITPSATAYEITTDRPNVFRTCFLDPFQSVAIARYIQEEGLNKVAVLYDNGDEYSTGLFKAFEEECAKQGINIVAVEAASGSDVDFKSQLTNIKNAGPEAVLLPFYGAPAALMLKQANEIGLDCKFFGADGISNIVDAISDKSLLPSIVYTDHFTTAATSELIPAFIASYEEKYAETPTISFTATAYDAALVLCEALQKAPSLAFEEVVTALKATSVDAVSGRITFDDHNDPIKSVFFLTFDEQGNKVFLTQLNP